MPLSSCPQQSSRHQPIKYLFFLVSSFSFLLILFYKQFLYHLEEKINHFPLHLSPSSYSPPLSRKKKKESERKSMPCSLQFFTHHSLFILLQSGPSRPWKLLPLKSAMVSFSHPSDQFSFLTILTLVQYLPWMTSDSYLEILLFPRFHRWTVSLFHSQL